MWDDFDNWLNEMAEQPGCETCGHIENQFPEWDDQVAKIEELVNKQVVL